MRHPSVVKHGIDRVAPELMLRFDCFQTSLGYEATINDDPAALIRFYNGKYKSAHNPDNYDDGLCRALDCRPDVVSPHDWLDAAIKAGLRGFGLYIYERAGRLPFVHLDVRPIKDLKRGRSMAIWGCRIFGDEDSGWRKDYGTLNDAFLFWDKHRAIGGTRPKVHGIKYT